jgi:hypothetical protein
MTRPFIAGDKVTDRGGLTEGVVLSEYDPDAWGRGITPEQAAERVRIMTLQGRDFASRVPVRWFRFGARSTGSGSVEWTNVGDLVALAVRPVK